MPEDQLENEAGEAVADPLAEMEQKYLRALADYQNLLRLTAKEKSDTIKYANQSLLEDILPVFSNLKMALQHAGEAQDAWLEGVRFVVKQFKEVLAGEGVVEVATEGQSFDHNLMDALSEQETADPSLDGLVAKEAAAGYLLNGRVIAPAKVIVYKLKQEER